jgi:hemolysin activation/secretion protein
VIETALQNTYSVNSLLSNVNPYLAAAAAAMTALPAQQQLIRNNLIQQQLKQQQTPPPPQQQQIKSLKSSPPQPPTQQQQNIIKEESSLNINDSNIKIELDGKDLWEQFYKHGTEMVITKSGRYVKFLFFSFLLISERVGEGERKHQF